MPSGNKPLLKPMLVPNGAIRPQWVKSYLSAVMTAWVKGILWNFSEKETLFIKEIALQNVCKMAAILSYPHFDRVSVKVIVA